MARRTSHSPLRPAHDHFDREPHDDFGGFQGDLAATGKAMDRRQLLRLAATFGVGAGALQLMGCGDSTPSSPSPPSGGGGTGSTCSRIPEETAGPYPADGSNGPTVLSATGVVRSDIRSSFAGLSGVAGGVPLTIELTLVSSSTCGPLAGRAMYLWHCDALERAGDRPLFPGKVAGQLFL